VYDDLSVNMVICCEDKDGWMVKEVNTIINAKEVHKISLFGTNIVWLLNLC